MTNEGTDMRAGRREWAALGVLTLAVVLLAVDGTVLALAVPALSQALDPSSTQMLWIGDSYSFVLAGLLVTMGNLADKIGRKKLLLIGAVGFGVASALAAFAPTTELLIAARVLLGVSGATIMPSTLSIVRNLFLDPKQRTTAIAIWSVGATAGAAAGPLVGGVLLQNFWWGSVFLINVPVMIVVLLAGTVLLPESKNPGATRIDLLSAALSVLAIVPVVYAIKTAFGGHFTWLSALAALVGPAAGTWFVRRQRRLDSPLIDVDLFRRPAFSGAVAANTIAIFAFSGLLFFFSQYLQLVREFSPIQAGLAELPSTIASVTVIAFVGTMVGRLGRGRSIGTGLLLTALGLFALAITEGLPSYVGIAIALAFVGLGIGVAMTVSTDAVMSAVPKERAGAASSISETAYELGLALGIAVLGSIHGSIYRGQSADTFDAGVPTAVSRDSLASASATLRAEGSPTSLALLEDLQHSFTLAMQITSVVAAVLVCAAAAVAWRTIPAGTTDRPHSH